MLVPRLPRAPSAAILALLALAAASLGCGSSDGSSGDSLPPDAASDASDDTSHEASPDGADAPAPGCDPNPCTQEHRTLCSVSDGGVVCSCDDGFVLHDNACVPAAKCQPDTCNAHGTCKVEQNAVVCTCQPGWAQPFCEECDASKGWHADGQGGCSQDPCVPDPCGGDPDLVCKATGGKAECVCRPGTHDEGGDCVPDSSCSPTTCSGHGTCTESSGKLTCSCDTGWAGTACDQCDTLSGWHLDGQGGCTQDPCLPNPCNLVHKTTCVVSGGNAVCQCDPGFHEEAGTCVEDDACQPTSCNGHGSCQVAGGVVVCSCDSGYIGSYCESCATGFHDDGAGGCTDDPCLPNPCKLPLQTVCVQNGPGFSCQCDSAAHPDGLGGCTTDPCTPNPCASQNLACKAVGSVAQCYTPDCDDANPCTDDTRVEGVCHNDPSPSGTPCATSACIVGQSCQTGACVGGAASNCNDSNPCTHDSCDPQTGCRNLIDASIVPDDAVPCTLDSCDALGAAHHVPDDATCDDGKFCTGVEKCSPASAGVDANGCVSNGAPSPPAVGSACVAFEPCVESEPHFVQKHAAVGTPCDDHIACTSGDACAAAGLCVGAAIAECLEAACTTTTPFDGTIDVPTATVGVDVTVNGQPLPGGANPSSDAMTVFLRAADTGALHQVRYLWYTSSGGPWPSPAEDAWSVLPGVYDVVYHRGYSNASAAVGENPAGDKLPNGYRVLQSGLVVGSGANQIAVDVPVSNIDVAVTVDGLPLPSGANPNIDTMTVYLRAADTGALHQVRHLWYTSSGGPWPSPATDAFSVVPGTYDVVYRRGYSSANAVVSENPDGDKLPNGYRVLQTGLHVAPGSSTVNVDVRTARIDAVNVTVGGLPLPSGGNPSSSTMNLYLRAKDTGALHLVRHLWYTSSGGPWPATPAKAWSLLPGEYEVVYRRDWSSSYDEVSANPAGDKLPSGYRVIVPSVTLKTGSNTLDIDVPVATIDAVDVKLDGAALPVGSSSSSDTLSVYLRAHDTGVLHRVRHLWYTSSGGPWPNPAEHAQSVPAGTYDVVVRKGWSSTYQVVSENDAADKLPMAYRVVQSNVVLAPGPNSLEVNLPVATLSDVAVLLDHAALPAGSSSNSDTAVIFLRARDTGALHQIRHFWYTSSGGPWPTTGDHSHSLLAGSYDVVFRRGWSSSDGIVDENPATDKLPNGFRVLQENITLNQGSNSIVVDLTQALLQANVTLDGAALPSGANPSSDTMIAYLRSRDTRTLHQLRHLWYTSSGGPWPSPPEHARSVPPGAYDLVYRRGMNATTNVVSENPENDKLPNGFRVLQRCLEVH